MNKKLLLLKIENIHAKQALIKVLIFFQKSIIVLSFLSKQEVTMNNGNILIL